MGAKPPPPLLPLVSPYVDTSIPSLSEANARHVIRTVAGWLISVSYHPRTGLLARVALRASGRILHREASRLFSPEVKDVSSE